MSRRKKGPQRRDVKMRIVEHVDQKAAEFASKRKGAKKIWAH